MSTRPAVMSCRIASAVIDLPTDPMTTGVVGVMALPPGPATPKAATCTTVPSCVTAYATPGIPDASIAARTLASTTEKSAAASATAVDAGMERSTIRRRPAAPPILGARDDMGVMPAQRDRPGAWRRIRRLARRSQRGSCRAGPEEPTRTFRPCRTDRCGPTRRRTDAASLDRILPRARRRFCAWSAGASRVACRRQAWPNRPNRNRGPLPAPLRHDGALV